MKGGAMDVDPVTGDPVYRDASSDGKAAADSPESQRLVRQAGLAGITGSEAAKKVKQAAYELFYRKIQEIISEDPECKAYLDILDVLGGMEDVARSAAVRLSGLR